MIGKVKKKILLVKTDLPYLKGSEYSFLVPVQLCEFALTENFCNPFRLYLYLKGQCSGKQKINKSDLKAFAAELNCNEKSIKNNLKKLIAANWVGYNKSSNYYFVRGFDFVMQLQGFISKTGTEFQKSYLNNFKAFTAGAVIGYMINTIRKRQVVGGKIAPSRQAACSSNGYSLSTRLLAKKINVSVGLASKLKRLASDAGFIQLKKGFQETEVPFDQKRFYAKAFPELSGRIRQKKGLLVLVDSDRIVSNIRFKKRKKRERYK